MRTTSTVEHAHRRGRLCALLALPAAALLSVTVAACSSANDDAASDISDAASAAGAGASGTAGEGNTGSSAARPDGSPVVDDPAKRGGNAKGAQGDVAASAERDGNNPAAAGVAGDAPKRGNAELLLGAEDFPGWTYQGVDPAEGIAAAQKISEAMKSLTVDPPECTDVAVGSPAIPDGSAAAQIQDPNSQSVYSVMIMGTGVDRGEFSDRFLHCPAFTLSGSGLTMKATNSPVDTPRIDKANVQGFRSSATSRVDALNQEQAQSQTFYQVTTRGVTFRVSALDMSEQPAPATIDALNDIAGRQAAKIVNG